MKKINGAAIAVLVIIAALLTSCSSQPKTAEAATETVHGIAVTTVARATVPDVLEATGTVRAAQSAQLAAQMMGNIVAINVREGDRVRQGQVLAVIDDAQPRAALERATAAVNAANQELVAAESEAALADSTFKRYQDLFQKKSVSPQEFDEIKTRQQAATARRDMARAGQAQARAMLQQAQTALDYTRVRAPFDGVITEKRVDTGALAAPGMPLLVMEDTRHFRLEATVDESEIRHVHLGQAVPVAIDALARQDLPGRVAQIVPAADPASRSFTVKLDLPAQPDMRSGLFGRAQFTRGQRDSLLLPRAAVIDRGQLQGVYVLDQDMIAQLRYVTLGRRVGERVEILSGLESGERVVAEPGERELGGKRIEVRQ
jgi:RND family efflux transporter MFP subunit